MWDFAMPSRKQKKNKKEKIKKKKEKRKTKTKYNSATVVIVRISHLDTNHLKLQDTGSSELKALARLNFWLSKLQSLRPKKYPAPGCY